MGEVYRARDTKLNRDVALKILPQTFATDPDRLARFHREARVLASLNHPHIAAIYGFEDSGDTHALVLELVEGPTLADRIARGPLPVDEALAIAAQIAEALEAAHEQGIIHRDLKPANIKVKPDGSVKVLDFGLAKLAEPAGSGQRAAGSALSMSPTITSPAMMTGVGVILGTASYMSPEQAKGRPADKRSDIWAFGCVLYEMLTGQRPFGGDDVTETIAAVVRGDPNWTALPAETSLTVRRLLQRCLEKDPRQRLRDIGDARLDINDVHDPLLNAEADAKPPLRPRRFARVVPLAAAAAIGASVTFLVIQWMPRTTGLPIQATAPLIRATIDLPSTAPLALGAEIPAIGFDAASLALSPDGRHLVYVGASDSRTMLYRRDMASGDVTALGGTEGARHAFFSPDGHWVGFLTDDSLRKVPVDGGAPITISNARVPVRAVWMRDDTIYFDQDQGVRISRVSANGGDAATVQNPGLEFALSDVLPDGNEALGTFKRGGMSSDYAEVMLMSLATGAKKAVLRSAYDARYIRSGHLLFGRGGNIYGVRFDVTRREVIGDPVLVVRSAAMDSFFQQVHAASSDTGTIAYVPGGDRATGRPAWVDRNGHAEFLPVPPRTYGVVNLAPSGDALAAHVADVADYVWIYDMKRGEGRKLAVPGSAGWPIWSPDGAHVAFTTWLTSREQARVVARTIDGNGDEQEIAPAMSGWTTAASSWSPDGRTVALDFWGPGFKNGFRNAAGGVDRDMTGDVDRWGSDFAPDGRWVAYASDETGQFEVRVRSYPDGKISKQISTGGGIEPRWCRCGELFFRNGNRWMSVRIRTTPDLQWEPPQPAFQTDFIDTPGRSYDVSPDGKRLLVVRRAEPDARNRINLIVNWTDALSGTVH